MQSELIHYVQGYVKLEVAGPGFERLINRLVQVGIVAWNIRRSGENRGEFLISLPDFFRLRPFLRETGCRMRVTKRYGLPFFLDKLGRRRWFVAGAAVFLIGLYAMASVVWSVEVEGNETIAENHILQVAAQEGIYPLQWKFRMKDQGALADNLTRALPNVAWVGVDVRGATVTIRVVEATVPEQRQPQNPRHLVSTSDGVVTSIIADRGVPLVGVHSRVKRGDILISGILGDEENRRVVVAEGRVRGLVWYEYNVRAPIVRTSWALTGERRSTFHLVIGDRALQVTGYFQKPFAHEQTDTARSHLRFGRWTLPIGWMTHTHREAVPVERRLGEAKAKEDALAGARADLLSKFGGSAVIRQEKILHERTDNGKVVMNVLFEAEVDIAVERPILEQELAPPPDEEGP